MAVKRWGRACTGDAGEKTRGTGKGHRARAWAGPQRWAGAFCCHKRGDGCSRLRLRPCTGSEWHIPSIALVALGGEAQEMFTTATRVQTGAQWERAWPAWGWGMRLPSPEA